MSFEKLLDELEALQKAQPIGTDEEDDEKIRAAADEDDEEGASGEEDEEKDEDEEYEETMGKSFRVTVDGKEIEAIDGTQVLTEFDTRLKTQEGQLTKALGYFDEEDGVMAKALAAIVDTRKGMGEMAKAIKDQGKLIKSLQTEIQQFGTQGRGRKATLSVLDKPGPQGSEDKPDGMTPRELMTKAQAAFKAGRITGGEISVIENYVGHSWPVPNALVAKVVGE